MFFSSPGNPRPPRFLSESIGYRAHEYNVTWATDSFAPITEYRLLYRRSDVSSKYRPLYRLLFLVLNSPLEDSTLLALVDYFIFSALL